jgi:hypothetical protein
VALGGDQGRSGKAADGAGDGHIGRPPTPPGCALSPLDQPFKSANVLSYDAALILLVLVLLLIICGRVIIAVSRRHAE